MKRIVSETRYTRVPDPKAKPEPHYDKYVQRVYKRMGFRPVEGAMGFTMHIDAYKVDGGYVPTISASETVDVEEEYLSVGELRELIRDLPDEAPVAIWDREDGSFYDTRAGEVVEGRVELQ